MKDFFEERDYLDPIRIFMPLGPAVSEVQDMLG